MGTIQFRPFAWSRPIGWANVRDDIRRRLDHPTRAVGDLRHYRAAATAPDRLVLMAVGPCPVPGCGRSRAAAVAPLLADNDRLHLFNHLVIDEHTAGETLRILEKKKPGATPRA